MKRTGVLIACLLTAATACSSHGGSAVLPQGTAGKAPVTAPAAKGTHATLSITVPKRGTSASEANRRSPLYVSPSSANLLVAVNGGTPATYGLTPQSPGCITQAGNLLCTFAIVAPSGNDAFALTLTDGAGNVLSRNVVNATLAAGVATPVNVTLAAVPASAEIVPGSGSSIEGSSAPYQFPALFAQPVEVEPLDIDGNIIIGPGAPTVTGVTVSTGSSYASVAAAGGTDPDAFVLRPGNGTAGGQTVTLSASVQGIALSDGTTSLPVIGTTSYTFTPAIVVGVGPDVAFYSVASGNEIAAFSACGGSCGLAIVSAVTADAKGNVYLSYSQFLGLGVSSALNVFAPGTVVPEYTLGSAAGVHSVSGIAVDSSGALYVANGSGFRQPAPSVEKFAPGATTPSYTITGIPSGISEPGGIAVAANGNIYVADSSSDVVNVFAQGAQTPLETLSDPSLANPDDVALDSAGDLYVSDATNEDIAYFSAGQTALISTLNDSSFYNWNGGASLMFDPLGNLWVSISTPGSLEELQANALPNNVVIGTQINGPAGSMGWIP